jgi:hypothetical protein
MMVMVVVLDDDKILLCDDQILPIDLAQNIGLQDLGWRAGGEEPGLE